MSNAEKLGKKIFEDIDNTQVYDCKTWPHFCHIKDVVRAVCAFFGIPEGAREGSVGLAVEALRERSYECSGSLDNPCDGCEYRSGDCKMQEALRAMGAEEKGAEGQ